MKTKEELNAIKEEVETVSKKLHELTKEEMAQVEGGRSGTSPHVCPRSSECARSHECVLCGQEKADMRKRCIHANYYLAPDKW